MAAEHTSVADVDTLSKVRSLGATNYNDALVFAAQGGHPSAMRLARTWGATNFDEAFADAARNNGKIDAMVLAKERGASDFDDALLKASTTGCVNVMELAKLWGATAFAE